jgi:hypothetical protein
METDINKVRGKILFWKTIDESGLTDKYLARAKELAQGFEELVGVSAADGVYPAKRFALAVLEVATYDYNGVGFDLGPEQVIEYYNKNLLDKHPLLIQKSNFVPSGEQLEGKWGKTQDAIADAFEKELRSNAESQEFDLINDASLEEMSVEGLRKTGIVDLNFKIDDNKLPQFNNNSKLGKIFFNDDGSIQSVECPSCYMHDCYVIGLDKYGCFNCDSEFNVPMEIGDNL